MPYEELAATIASKYAEISNVFGEFQRKSGLACPSGCGKCCINPEISCSPYELLPFTLYLLKTGNAENFLEKIDLHQNDHCPLLIDVDKVKGKGICSAYEYRPFVCRVFGVAARHGKNEQIEYSICKVLQEDKAYASLPNFAEEKIPFIEDWKKKLESVHPKLLERPVPIKEALLIMIEKVLLWDSFRNLKS